MNIFIGNPSHQDYYQGNLGRKAMETAGETLSRAQRAQRAKSIANEISVHKSAIGELQKKHGQFKRDHNRRADYDWKDNNARAERLDRLITNSGLTRAEIASSAGITPQHLSRVLRVKNTPLGKQLERDIRAAVEELQKKHGQFKRDHNRRADYDWKDNNARAERLNQIIVDSGLKRVEIAAHIGITPQHLSRVLRVKSAPLGKQLERRIEKAIANLKKRGSD